MVRYQKGHKNSKGERAEWVIVSHKDGHIISSHKTKEDAEKHLKDIQKFKHIGESMHLDEAKEILNKAGFILERYELDYDSVNSSFDEEKRLEKFGEYLYEVRELLYRKGFSRGKQADNYDELHDIAHRCCRLGKSIEYCAKEIILTIK